MYVLDDEITLCAVHVTILTGKPGKESENFNVCEKRFVKYERKKNLHLNGENEQKKNLFSCKSKTFS